MHGHAVPSAEGDTGRSSTKLCRPLSMAAGPTAAPPGLRGHLEGLRHLHDPPWSLSTLMVHAAGFKQHFASHAVSTRETCCIFLKLHGDGRLQGHPILTHRWGTKWRPSPSQATSE